MFCDPHFTQDAGLPDEAMIMPEMKQLFLEQQMRSSVTAASPSLAELISVGLCGTPCCGFIDLCDGLCRDVLSADEGRVQPPPRLKPR